MAETQCIAGDFIYLIMNRLLAILCSLLASISLAAQSGNPDLKVDSKLFDFGTIDEAAGRVSHTFRLTNIGSEPIVIVSVRTGCRCVTAVAPTKPIAPGATADLIVRFDPAGRSGSFHKEVTVVSTDKKINRVNIKGVVKASPSAKRDNYHCDLGHGLMTNRSKINFGRVAKGSSKSVELRFMNDFPVGMQLSFELEETPAGFDILIPSSHILPPDGEGTITLTAIATGKLPSARTVNLIPIVNGYRLTPIPLTLLPN